MSTPVQAVLSLVVVLHAAGERLVVWHVNVGQAIGLSRLSGAWVLERGRGAEIGSLTEGYAVVGSDADVVVPEGIRASGVVDVDATFDAAREEIARVDEAFSTHQERVGGKLVRPTWPGVVHPKEVRKPVYEVDETVRPALILARGIADLADAWTAFESLRVARPFLHEQGGSGARPLPLAVR